MWDLLAWVISFLLTIAILYIVLYQLLCLLELESDYSNAHDVAARVNNVVPYEIVVQGTLCLLHLVSGHWLMLLLCLPYIFYNASLYTRRRHLVDVTEIFSQLQMEKKQRRYKLAYLAFFFFCSIFWIYFAVGID